MSSVECSSVQQVAQEFGPNPLEGVTDVRLGGASGSAEVIATDCVGSGMNVENRNS